MSKSINHLATADGLFFGKGGLDQRRHVRSAPGNQDGDAAFHGFT